METDLTDLTDEQLKKIGRPPPPWREKNSSFIGDPGMADFIVATMLPAFSLSPKVKGIDAGRTKNRQSDI